MRLSFVLSLMPLAGFVGALHVTEPEEGADVKASSSLTVKWTSVNTDASSFNLYLVNNAVYPPVSKKLATDVETSKGSYTIDNIGSVTAGHGYQINLQSDVSQDTGILAQSQQFNVTGSSQSSSASGSTSSSSTTSTSGSTTSTLTDTLITTTSASTATGTTTVTGTTSSTGASSSSTSSATAAPATGAGAALVAHSIAAAGLLAGALALNL
ncbi:uncharacterized protein N7482_003442 [Penicillium canariense]|uniref:Yeast cell wall synthesis Kre9/Knh1-like N-terminal domain-containing protein n=1 Tax=Penicillium canariense TaxID=189055 RepID=A0A9W9I6T5_9EURO|nr:uncharacterized protein N7482_003442 [Penicillium canariense]KAJ5167848.1 hypothetical protein N7482_003442 [Penicillium canariense]